MAHERWATYSVVAHHDAAALVRDVLLYDKLILPCPPDATEEQRWETNGWRPDLLKHRLEQLDGLVRRVNWDAAPQGKFHEMMARLRDDVGPFGATSMVLREWIEPQVRELGIGVVAAFRNEDDLRRDYLVSPSAAEAEASMTLALVHDLLVPFTDRDPEDALSAAAALAGEPEFQRHRRDYYRWQETIGAQIAHGETDLATARQDLLDRVAVYNDQIARADRKAKRTLLVTLAGTAIGITTALLGPPGWLALLAGAGAALPLVLVEKSQVAAGSGEPAVMFYDVRRALR